MTTVFEIPLQEGPQTFLAVLGETQYRLTFKWNTAAGVWMLDLATNEDSPIAQSLALVPGVDVLGQFKHLGIGGRLFFQTSPDPNAAPLFDDMGVSTNLFFVLD